MRLLLVEDDVMVASGIKLGLTDAGYAVDWVGSGERAEDVLRNESFDAAIIDIGLPGMDGLELTRRLRRPDMPSRSMPVLILTARDALHDRVQGLDLGADDYMVKPFQLPELLARVRALIRRSHSAVSSVLKVGALSIDMARRTAEVHGAALDLTGREWEILQQLMLASPNVMAKQKLVESLSEWDNELTLNAVEIYVSRLRNKLQDCGVEIRTIRGIGYRLDEIS